MRAEPLTRALGGRWHGSYGMARCPAHNGRRPSLSIRDGYDGRLLLHCHAGCEFRAVVAALSGRGIDEARPPGHRFEKQSSGVNSNRPVEDLIGLIWAQTRPIMQTLGEKYLRNRGIEVELPSSLRFHPRLRHPSGRHLPAIIGRVEHVRVGFVGLHRTYLDAASAKKTSLQPNKAMLGQCKGGAIRIRQGSVGLAVCEGVETALSLASGLDNGFAVWAALSTAGVAALELPSRGEFGGTLLIGTDGDPPGRAAGFKLADRAAMLGWSVEIASAPDGRDFNDLARSERHG